MNLYVISGVTGMTGNELVRRILAESADEVIGFDNFFCSSIKTIADCLSNSRFRFFSYDLNNTTEMEALFHLVQLEKKRFTNVIYVNCAAVVHTEHFYHVHDTFETNVVGMKTFLEQAIRAGANTFINCSTSEVYSMHSDEGGGGVAEDSYLLLAHAEHSQRTSYAAGKLLTEFFMKDAVAKGDINGCSIRFANVYSRNERFAKHIIPYIFDRLICEETVELLENSRVNRRTFLHNIDSCRAVLSLAAHPDALDGSIYNVATEEEVTIPELVDRCARAMGIESYEIVYKGYRESDPVRRLLSTEKIRKKTGWSPKICLDEGLAMCAQFRREEGQGVC